jgi:hypothetical protein
MRSFLCLLFIGSMLTLSSFGQFKIPNEQTYSAILQIDSSDYFICGSVVSKATKAKYNVSSSSPYEGYSQAQVFWTSAIVINSKTKTGKSLFTQGPVYIYPVTVFYTKPMWDFNPPFKAPSSGILRDHILVMAKTDEVNKDGLIDDDDPSQIYLAGKDGTGFTRVTNNSMHVTGWKISKDGLVVLFTAQVDTNGDKKFSDEEPEAIFEIELQKIIAQIKVEQIKL